MTKHFVLNPQHDEGVCVENQLRFNTKLFLREADSSQNGGFGGSLFCVETRVLFNTNCLVQPARAFNKFF